MDINPSIGIGSIKFGMLENELIEILGKPDKTGEFLHCEGVDDWYKECNYFNLGLSFQFESSDDFKLCNISITGKGHLLFGQDILGFNIKWADKYLERHLKERPEYEDCTWGKPELSELLGVEGHGLMLWFKSGTLDEIVCSYIFESDNNTVIWPK